MCTDPNSLTNPNRRRAVRLGADGKSSFNPMIPTPNNDLRPDQDIVSNRDLTEKVASHIAVKAMSYRYLWTTKKITVCFYMCHAHKLYFLYDASMFYDNSTGTQYPLFQGSDPATKRPKGTHQE